MYTIDLCCTINFHAHAHAHTHAHTLEFRCESKHCWCCLSNPEKWTRNRYIYLSISVECRVSHIAQVKIIKYEHSRSSFNIQFADLFTWFSHFNWKRITSFGTKRDRNIKNDTKCEILECQQHDGAIHVFDTFLVFKIEAAWLMTMAAAK